MVLDQIKRYIPSQIKSVLKRFPIPLTKNHKYDLYTKKVLKSYLKPNSNCIDVGCYQGEILDLFLQYAPRGSHLAIEPIEANFKQLKHKYRQQENVELFKTALSNTDSQSEFHYVKTNPSYSGLKRRNYEREETIEVVNVNTSRLDAVAKNRCVDCIKIDVEGAEYLVLEGAKQTIISNKPLIIFEHGKGASEFYGYSTAKLYDLLQELGLNIYTFECYFAKKESLSRYEFITQFEEKINYYFVAHA